MRPERQVALPNFPMARHKHPIRNQAIRGCVRHYGIPQEPTLFQSFTSHLLFSMYEPCTDGLLLSPAELIDALVNNTPGMDLTYRSRQRRLNLSAHEISSDRTLC